MDGLDRLRVEDLGEDRQGLDQTGTGSVEELVSVGQEHASLFYRAQLGPGRPLDHAHQLLARAAEIEATGKHDDHVGIGIRELSDREPRGVGARSAQQVLAAGQRHQLRDPVSGGHQGVQPLDAGHARSPRLAGSPLCDLREPVRQRIGQLAAAFAGAESHGYLDDRAPDITKSLGRQRHDLGPFAGPDRERGFQVSEAGGADLALVLGQDVGRSQLAEPIRVDLVDREPVAHQALHPVVDLAAAGPSVELGPGEHRQVPDLGREIAFVGTADQLRAEAQGTGDLGRAGEQGDDPFHP